MDKEWFILIEGKQEGPYSPRELKLDPRVTPDTLVWKKGFTNWVPIRHVPELKDVFKDQPKSKPLHEKSKPPSTDLIEKQEVLILNRDPSQFFLWLLIILLILFYVIYQLNNP